MHCRLREVIELIDTFETVSSDLDSWMSAILPSLDTEKCSLQMVSPDDDKLTAADAVLQV